jgi:hypothetical protein
MTTNPHELPQPHEAEDGTLEPEATTADELLETKPDYAAPEQNAKNDAPVEDADDAESFQDDSAPVEVESDEKGFIPSADNPDEGKVTPTPADVAPKNQEKGDDKA